MMKVGMLNTQLAFRATQGSFKPLNSQGQKITITRIYSASTEHHFLYYITMQSKILP